MSLINDALRRTLQRIQAGDPPRPDDLDLHPVESGESDPSDDAGRARKIIWGLVGFVVVGNLVLWILFKDGGRGTEVEARTMEEDAPAAVAGESGSDPGTNTASGSGVVSVAASLAPAPPPKAPLLKLKSVMAHPTRPSALINDRVVFVGDTVDGWTVTAIEPDRVTVRVGGKDQVITLP